MRSNFKVLVAGIVLSLQIQVHAARVERRSLTSAFVSRTISYVVVLPDSYQMRIAQGERFPVLYLLHCLGCSEESWLDPSYCEGLGELVDSLGFIVAAPYDGNVSSWWLDSPYRPSSQFSSFLAREFVIEIDSRYATVPLASKRGLAGHSMGGFGAMHNLIEHPDVFGHAFSIKGGLDPRYPPNPTWPGNFQLEGSLGTTPADQVNWERVNVLGNICRLRDRGVRIGFYSGLGDTWFHKENDSLHQVLSTCGIEHTYWVDSTENHFRVPRRSMTRAMAFFADGFSRVSVKRSRTTVPSLSGRWDNTCLYSIRGQKVGIVPKRGRAVYLHRSAAGSLQRCPIKLSR